MIASTNGMSDKAPEARTAVMIMVEVTWTDQSGTVRTCPACMENRSPGGACIRLRHAIPVGTTLRLRWRWEQFTGTSRYCRSEGKDYRVGLQRAAAETAITTPERSDAQAWRKLHERHTNESARAQRPAEENVAKSKLAASRVPMLAELAAPPETKQQSAPARPLPENEIFVLRESERAQGPKEERNEANPERKHMRRKWFEMAHKGDTQEHGAFTVAGTAHNTEPGSGANASVNAIPEVKAVAKEADSGGSSSIELLSMPDIYQTAGILNPRKGYSILKVVEMLRSEHLHGLSKEMKRASVLVALDAAGISVDEVAGDAKARIEAIDSYEGAQRKQFEALLARKTEENQQIMAELERIKASYAERLRRNLEGVAREKATFGNWLTTKQQEAENIAEALELCLKPQASENAGNALENSLVGANAKPV